MVDSTQSPVAEGVIAAATDHGDNAVVVFIDNHAGRKFKAGERVTIKPALNEEVFDRKCKFCNKTTTTLVWWKCCPTHCSEFGSDVVCQTCKEEKHPERSNNG